MHRQSISTAQQQAYATGNRQAVEQQHKQGMRVQAPTGHPLANQYAPNHAVRNTNYANTGIVDRQTADRSYSNRQQIRSQTHNQLLPHNQQYPHQINNRNTGQRNQMNNNAAYDVSPRDLRLSTPTVELQHRADVPTEYNFGDVTRSMVTKGNLATSLAVFLEENEFQ